MSKKVLVVFGATGNQGGSVANYVLSDPELSQQFHVRAISRNTDNPKLAALKSQGAEVVSADLDDPTTLPSALKDAHTIFALTNTQYTGNTKAIETRQANSLLDECESQKVKYIIWSSMSHPYKISSGKLTRVEHFDVKAEIEQEIRKRGIPAAFFAPGSFMQNFLSHMMAPRPSPAGDGTFVIANSSSADTQIPLIDIGDTGKWVGAILTNPNYYNGKFIAASERLYSYTEIVDIISRVSGKTVTHQQVPGEVFKSWLPEGFREELFEMFELMREYGYYGEKMVEEVEWASKQTRGKLTGLEEFLKRQNIKLE